MTAPGQEPDEILTAEPVEAERREAEPNLKGIGDNQMPEDLREAERERPENAAPEDAPAEDGGGADR